MVIQALSLLPVAQRAAGVPARSSDAWHALRCCANKFPMYGVLAWASLTLNRGFRETFSKDCMALIYSRRGRILHQLDQSHNHSDSPLSSSKVPGHTCVRKIRSRRACGTSTTGPANNIQHYSLHRPNAQRSCERLFRCLYASGNRVGKALGKGPKVHTETTAMAFGCFKCIWMSGSVLLQHCLRLPKSC